MNNTIIKLLQKSFFFMFILIHNLFGGSEFYKLKYNYPNFFQDAHAYKMNFVPSEDIKVYDRLLKENKIVIFENNLGSFIFANFYTMDVFQILQKKHKDCVSYVFCANGDFGYFKILENGKIVRKIASFGNIDGIKSYPETRGVPCSFEIENNVVFKIDRKAIWLTDQLKNFGHEEMLDLIDYYIGFSEIETAHIDNTIVYELK